MSAKDTNYLSHIRFVHRPYKRPDKHSRATPKQAFDHTRAYRVLTTNVSNTFVDISTNLHQVVGKMGTIDTTIIPMFYVGAEEDMDRFLRWLNNVGMLDEDGKPRPLFVIEQYVEDVHAENKNNVREGRATIQLLFPNQLDSLMVLTDYSPNKSKKYSIY
jgi:hypothetical protein